MRVRPPACARTMLAPVAHQPERSATPPVLYRFGPVATIAIITTALGGHVRPAIRLGGVLAGQGHRVLSWTDEMFRAPVETAACEFHPLNPVPYPWPYRGLVGFAAILAWATDQCAERLISELFESDVELVIHDDHAPWGRVAADFLGLPRVVSNPMFPRPPELWPAFAQSWSRRAPPSPPEAELELRHRRDAIIRRWGVDLGEWHSVMVQTAPLTVSYTTAEISGQTVLPAGWRYVGPLMGPAPDLAPPAERPLIYVAFGTFFNYSPRPFKLAIEALASEPVDVLIAGGPAVTDRRLELGPLPENVQLHGLVASRAVLASASVHITHGGSGSVHESLLAGVPMLCMPQGSDQHAWCDRVQALGAGQIVEPDPDALCAAVRLLLGDHETQSRTAALGRRLEQYDGKAEVASLVEQALDSSSATPASRH